MRRPPSVATGNRLTVFTPRIDALLREHRGAGLFRLDQDTVGVADPELIDAILRCRPANAFERPTFKPLQGRVISRPESSAVMRAVSRDVKSALTRPVAEGVDLTGEWPHVVHAHLRDLVFGADPHRLKAMVDRRLELTPRLTWSVIAAGAALRLRPRPGTGVSHLGELLVEAGTYQERRHAMGLYRRAAAPVCFTVAALVTGALWLGAPFDDDVPNRHIIHETLRLLPVSWNLLRVASPEFHALDDRIGTHDDVLMLPLLTHRDPALWDDPDAFRPERWNGIDPDDHPGYLPFGHANERCWGRHMVMPLAERLLDIARRDRLTVDPLQDSARVPLHGLLGVTGVRVVRWA
ncbi:cytochrome P450 [Streptomyces sp. NPDC088354]|uniref:cytochrome P450 n=1 Tax=unclassified Streptomyces TaxID=2593676 RepID=UPI0029A89C52|nr:cytochrome P450 [Streptomyces sp. MI02-7b]MDX3072705.1 cytochrome P450 [Streptomyces sp. MI02-7b]